MDNILHHESVLEHNRRYIPGGISSVNRAIDPAITFTKGEGAYLWDAAGKRYIDFHAGFAPYFLGHNFAPINDAAAAALKSGDSLFGAGPSKAEGQLAELICRNVPAVEKVTFLNTGSEATSLAIRIGRAVTQRSHIIVMQGGYNGNHDELACNVFNSLADIGPRVSPGEYPLRPLGAGTTIEQTHFVHADEFGFLLVFDEVKTGFRHALGGYSQVCGVTPDLVVYGKAVANGFPLALVGGKTEYMDSIIDPDPKHRPFVAGTYNGHPVAVAAATETVRYLAANKHEIYPRMEAMGAAMEAGITSIFAKRGIAACVARQGSAFSFYMMSKPPKDLHDIIEGHDFVRDVALRRALIQRGVFFVPIATKQCSLSAAHSDADVQFTLEQFESAVKAIW
jgi:glutamate-1-semialdehyde 2,1-aminomutase